MTIDLNGSTIIHKTSNYKVEVCVIPHDENTGETMFFLDYADGKNITSHKDLAEVVALANEMQRLDEQLAA